VLVPALPGCVTYGKTVEEAIEMARDVITGYVESLIEDGGAVPIRMISSNAETEGRVRRVTVPVHSSQGIAMGTLSKF